MSFFGGDGGEAKRQQAEARERTQKANEDASREQQRAERGGTRRGGRALLVGNLSARLTKMLGG